MVFPLLRVLRVIRIVKLFRGCVASKRNSVVFDDTHHLSGYIPRMWCELKEKEEAAKCRKDGDRVSHPRLGTRSTCDPCTHVRDPLRRWDVSACVQKQPCEILNSWVYTLQIHTHTHTNVTWSSFSRITWTNGDSSLLTDTTIFYVALCTEYRRELRSIREWRYKHASLQWIKLSLCCIFFVKQRTLKKSSKRSWVFFFQYD